MLQRKLLSTEDRCPFWLLAWSETLPERLAGGSVRIKRSWKTN